MSVKFLRYNQSNFTRGFTLVELLIVVIIIGVLAGFAIPMYNNVLLKAKVAKAKHNLALLAEAEKNYFTQKGAYEWDFASLTAASDITGMEVDFTSFNDADWNYTGQGGTGGGLGMIAWLTATKQTDPCKDKAILFFVRGQAAVSGGRIQVDSCFPQ